METNIEIRYLLIGRALGERKPVACSFVVYAELHSAVGSELLRDFDEIIISKVRVDGQR